MLAEARDNCDYLMVGLHSDPTIDRRAKNRPIQTLFERWIQVHGSGWVDEIIPYSHEADILNILRSCEAEIRFIGEEYRDQDFTGKGLCNKNGKLIEIFYNTRRHSFSTTELRERIKDGR